jgi:predicted GNAT family acetyltransferase
MPDEFMLNRDHAGRVTGVVFYGMQLVLAADDDGTIDLFAVEARRRTNVRSIVGPKAAVDRLWGGMKSWHRAPALLRGEQPLYVLQPTALAPVADVDVRLALLEEADLVADHSGAMTLGELGYDPRRHYVGFAASIRRAITAGTWWVWIVDGELRFQCCVGARTRATAQIQGVWSPPEVRGHGYATLALGAISRRLFATHATVSLYVNDFNQEAIALYERLGFTQAGAFTTMIF